MRKTWWWIGALAACGNPHEQACQDYVAAAITCFEDADVPLPDTIDAATCTDRSSGETYYRCLEAAFTDGDCADEAAEELSQALQGCVLETEE